jgi:oligoribonuclease
MLVWIDLEMTGLEPERHVIVEIATIITDDHLNVIAEGPDLVIHATPEQLAQMGDFVTEMHTKSGLLTEIEAATVTVPEAEAATLAFLREHAVEEGTVPLCGNSIGTDRRFLQQYMPTLESFFHYRNVDVSTIKELARRWNPEVLSALPEKETAHRALGDIRESIAELVPYRTALRNRAGHRQRCRHDGVEARASQPATDTGHVAQTRVERLPRLRGPTSHVRRALPRRINPEPTPRGPGLR